MTRNALFTLCAYALVSLSCSMAMAQAPAPAPAQAPAPAGDAKAGSQLIQRCQGCHGIEGWRTAYPEVYTVPRIGGQHSAYLVSALNAYKSGARRHPGMRGIAVSLSDKDMADLAAYYAEAK